MTVLVTGGAGFIGSAVIRNLILNQGEQVVNVDKLTYAGNLASLEAVQEDARYSFERADICDAGKLERIFSQYAPTSVLHLAAESHVDRSIDRPEDFIQTNIVGAYTLLEVARRYFDTLPAPGKEAFRFVHVSTDEVFGALGPTGVFSEDSPYRPNSPYAASKAASDHLVRAWHRTYGLPAIVTNCSNNYGPFQYPEKLIPVAILNALNGTPLPVYGAGENKRDWLYVDDHAQALAMVLSRGRVGETYNIGSDNEHRNIDLVRAVCAILDELLPDSPHVPHSSLIAFVPDRLGHDFRYAIDARKVETELGWRPAYTFDTGLRKTVEWYLANLDWCRDVLANGVTNARRETRR